MYILVWKMSFEYVEEKLVLSSQFVSHFNFPTSESTSANIVEEILEGKRGAQPEKFMALKWKFLNSRSTE
jgi:hypothetical protein